MSAVKERIKQIIDRLPDEVAVDVERMLTEVAEGADLRDWHALATTAMGQWFDDDEVEYTEADLQNGAA